MAIPGSDLLEVPTVPTIYKAYFEAEISGNIPAKFGQKYDTVPPI